MSKTMELKMNLNKEEFNQWLDMIGDAGKLPKEGIDKLRKMNEERIEPLQCTRCNHKWIPRKKELPKVCPLCNSPYWNKKRIKELKK